MRRRSTKHHPNIAEIVQSAQHLELLEVSSFVIEGRVGALLGDEVVIGGQGSLIFKPRNQWHTFWNAGDEPARLLEIISPAGFEKFFRERLSLGGVTQMEARSLVDLCARYGLEMDLDSIPGLVERFSLLFPGEPLK